MDTFYFSQIIIIINLVNSSLCWHYFTSVKDLKLSNTPPDPTVVHSEYVYGNCKKQQTKDSITFYAHTHLDHMDILGKVIVRGWVDLLRIPTCIVLRATGYQSDTFRSTAYNFQMCVPRISYCHSKYRYKYFFYEWYIPAEYNGGMDWDIYFFGPPSPAW